MKRKPPSTKKPKNAPSPSDRPSASLREPKVLAPEVLPADDTEHDDEEEPTSDETETETETEPSPTEDDLLESGAPPASHSLTPFEGEAGSLAHHDPLKVYMDEIRRYELLPPEEEFALALKLRDEDNPAEAR